MNDKALKIVACEKKKMRPRTSKNIAPKWVIFRLLLYASFSLKQT